MPTSLRNFAATLAAVGLLSLGSFTIAQQDADQPPSDPSSIENIENSADVAEIRPADEVESARPDTPPADPNNAADADRNMDTSEENASDTSDAIDADENRGDSSDNANNNNDDNNREENRDESDENKQLMPPEVPEQARDRDANAREDVNADWRKVDRDGATWFYSPSGQWHVRQGDNWHAYHDGMHVGDLNRAGGMYGDRSVVRNDGRRMNNGQQRYSTGYRGEEAYHSANGQQHAKQVRYDRCGRAYICENGRAVYLDVAESANQNESSDQQQPTEADEQYQDVPPPPEMDEAKDTSADRGNVPMPPAPPAAG